MSLAELTDASLVARPRQGDLEAWNVFVERFSRYVYAITTRAYRLAPHDAEDVFQEVFARAFEQLDKLRSDEAVRAWIGQLTRRLCVDRHRAGGREEPGEIPEQAVVDETLESIDETLAVRSCARHMREEDPPQLRPVKSMTEEALPEETLAMLLTLLPPAPEAWIRAAKELPAARAQIDSLVARAEQDAEYRRLVVQDLEQALLTEGIEPSLALQRVLARRLENNES